MGKRILIEHGCTVPDKYIELEEYEELCERCKGTGRVREYFGPPGGWDGMVNCPDCGGAGKRLRCSGCGQLQHHPILHHEGAEWVDTLCLNCIMKHKKFRKLLEAER